MPANPPESFKDNIMKIAKHHRKYCEGEKCDISLIMLMTTAEASGIKFTKKEKEMFY